MSFRQLFGSSSTIDRLQLLMSRSSCGSMPDRPVSDGAGRGGAQLLSSACGLVTAIPCIRATSIGTTSRPRGHKEIGISLTFAIANGMPMIVIARRHAVTTWAIASSQPSRMSQMMFPMNEPTPAVGFAGSSQ
jgi:hypothetical protein